MKTETIYQEKRELDRLKMQERLLAPYEVPVYNKVLDHPDMFVLDIGSNDGTKIRNRFQNTNVKKLIGLECQEELTQIAQMNCPDQRFSFYTCDVESDDLDAHLQTCMEAEGIKGFDLIHLSFVLMHIKEPQKLLTRLKKYLLPGGKLLIAEADDSHSKLLPDTDGLFDTFLRLLHIDPLAGDRMCGARVPDYLKEAGYEHIVQERSALWARGSQLQRKEDMFEMFSSYLEEDLIYLLRKEPNRSEYVDALNWLSQNYERMRTSLVNPETEFAVGEILVTCDNAE